MAQIRTRQIQMIIHFRLSASEDRHLQSFLKGIFTKVAGVSFPTAPGGGPYEMYDSHYQLSSAVASRSDFDCLWVAKKKLTICEIAPSPVTLQAVPNESIAM